MRTDLIFPLLTVALYYLGARAKVTHWLWSRYPHWLDSFMVCAACSGFWYGVFIAIFGGYYGLSFVGIDLTKPESVIIVGLCSLVWTPLLAWLHVSALEHLEMPPPEPIADSEEA